MSISTTVTSRSTLIDYCKRRLGHPVIEINVDDDQVTDRIDDALQFMAEYHFDSTQRTYLAHQITAADITNKYISLTATGGVDPNNQIMSIIQVLPLTNRSSGMFDVRYQYALNDLYRYGAVEISSYYIIQSHMALLNQFFATQKNVRFNRVEDKLYLDTSWSEEFNAGDYIVIEAWITLDPESHTEIYNNIFLKQYATALVKRQWGANLKKFSGIALPGNVTLNGDTIFQEATEEIRQLEDTIMSRWEEFPEFFMG